MSARKALNRICTIAFLTLLAMVIQYSQAKVIVHRKVSNIVFTGIDLYKDVRKNDNESIHVVNSMTYDDFASNHILVAIGYSISTINLDTLELHHIIGDRHKNGYIEGKGQTARFENMQGIVKSPIDYPNNILVADSENFCIRTVNRITNISSHFTGECQSEGNVDGAITMAKLGRANALTTNPKESKNEYYFYDSSYEIIKILHWSSSSAEWMIDAVIGWQGEYIYSFTPHPRRDQIYLTTEDGVFEYTPSTTSFKVIVNGTVGHNDGSLSSANVSHPSKLVFLSDDVLVITDTLNFLLRVVDLGTKMISSICNRHINRRKFSPGNVTHCSLNYAFHMINHPTKSSVIISSKDKLYELSYTVLHSTTAAGLSKSTRQVLHSTTAAGLSKSTRQGTTIDNSEKKDISTEAQALRQVQSGENDIKLYAGIAGGMVAVAAIIAIVAYFVKKGSGAKENPDHPDAMIPAQYPPEPSDPSEVVLAAATVAAAYTPEVQATRFAEESTLPVEPSVASGTSVHSGKSRKNIKKKSRKKRA